MKPESDASRLLRRLRNRKTTTERPTARTVSTTSTTARPKRKVTTPVTRNDLANIQKMERSLASCQNTSLAFKSEIRDLSVRNAVCNSERSKMSAYLNTKFVENQRMHKDSLIDKATIKILNASNAELLANQSVLLERGLACESIQLSYDEMSHNVTTKSLESGCEIFGMKSSSALIMTSLLSFGIGALIVVAVFLILKFSNFVLGEFTKLLCLCVRVCIVYYF